MKKKCDITCDKLCLVLHLCVPPPLCEVRVCYSDKVSASCHQGTPPVSHLHPYSPPGY